MRFICLFLSASLSGFAVAGEPQCPPLSKASAKCGELKALIGQLKDQDVCRRTAAAYCLSDSFAHKAVAPLLRALKDSSPQVRAQAALSLADTGHTGAAKALLALLKGDSDASVRAAAAQALGVLNDAKAGPALVAALSADAAPEPRREAALALGKINYDPAQNALIRALKDKDESVRAAAAQGLAGGSGFNTARTLSGLMLLDSDEKVRQEAALSLGQCCAGPPESLHYSAGFDDWAFFDPDFDPFLDPFPYEEVTVRLGKSRGGLQQDVESALSYALANDKDAAIRAAAAQALGRSDDVSVAPALVDALRKDTSPLVRAHAAMALGAIKDYKDEDYLTSALSDKDGDVRMEAEIALQLMK